MKFARRSVSDQDIRRYEMFSQVCRGLDFTCACTYTPLRTCNNREDSETTLNSPKVKVDLRQLL